MKYGWFMQIWSHTHTHTSGTDSIWSVIISDIVYEGNSPPRICA